MDIDMDAREETAQTQRNGQQEEAGPAPPSVEADLERVTAEGPVEPNFTPAGALASITVSSVTRSRYSPPGGLPRRRTRSNGSENGEIARPSSAPLPDRPRVDVPPEDGLRPSDLMMPDTSGDRFPVGSAVNQFFVNLAELAATESAQISTDDALVEGLVLTGRGNGMEDAVQVLGGGTQEETTPLLGTSMVLGPALGSPIVPINPSSDPASNGSLPAQQNQSAAQGRSTNLLSSLQDLRANLQVRVESLGQEVERLRRRAEALERGILQDTTGGEAPTTAATEQPGAELGSEQRTQAFREANLRVRQLRLLRQQRAAEAADLRASTPVWGPPGSTSPGTGGRRDPSIVDSTAVGFAQTRTRVEAPPSERKRGSGVLEIEQGDRMWRRARRVAAYEVKTPETKPLAVSPARHEASRMTGAEVQSADRPSRVLQDRDANLQLMRDIYGDLGNLADLDRSSPWRFVPEQPTRASAATALPAADATGVTAPARTYTPEQLERLRHPARAFGTVSSTAEREGMTSRGRRVADRMERSASNGGEGAPPNNAFARAQTDINNTLTRYRDALLSNGANRVPRSNNTAISTDSSIELIPELVRMGVPAAALLQPAPRGQHGSSAPTLPDHRSEILAAEDVTTSVDLADDVPVAADPSETGTGASSGANLSRSVTLRFPPSRLANPARLQAQGARGGASLNDRPDAATPDAVAVTQDALNQLSVLSQTVTVLSERLDSARRLMRATMGPPASARASSTEADAAPGSPARMAMVALANRLSTSNARSTTGGTAAPASIPPPAAISLGRTPRRPTYPASHTIYHPHHRPRIGPDPLTTVINCDNFNSFDINFDGNIIFRPAAARAPHRELIARCLSMLPGGRDGLPSPWMRMTGENGSRPRRPAATAGYWVRWISGPDVQPEGLRLREMQWNNLPPIVAFQFAVCPADDEPFVRADEVEFITPHTRLRPHLGPWMHSRVRIAPFENDPPIARWGTSAHVRQAAEAVGGLGTGDHLTVNLLDRTVEVHRAGAGANANARGGLGRSRDASAAVPGARAAGQAAASTSAIRAAQVPTTGATAAPATDSGDGDGDGRDADRWLSAYEPAISQIRGEWRVHYRNQGLGPLPLSGAAETDEETALSGSDTREGGPVRRAQTHQQFRPHHQQLRWSRDFLNADGEFLPPARANAPPTATAPVSPHLPVVGFEPDESGLVQYI